jgi:hypothetical protein
MGRLFLLLSGDELELWKFVTCQNLRVENREGREKIRGLQEMTAAEGLPDLT